MYTTGGKIISMVKNERLILDNVYEGVQKGWGWGVRGCLEGLNKGCDVMAVHVLQ